jgi:hypothetical protein
VTLSPMDRDMCGSFLHPPLRCQRAATAQFADLNHKKKNLTTLHEVRFKTNTNRPCGALKMEAEGLTKYL